MKNIKKGLKLVYVRGIITQHVSCVVYASLLSCGGKVFKHTYIDDAADEKRAKGEYMPAWIPRTLPHSFTANSHNNTSPF